MNGVTLAERADRVAADLRSCLEPWRDAKGRADTIADARHNLAIALAEERTGVSHMQARLISIYSRRELRPSQVEAAKIFGSALTAAYKELDVDLARLLTIAEEYAGERTASAA